MEGCPTAYMLTECELNGFKVKIIFRKEGDEWAFFKSAGISGWQPTEDIVPDEIFHCPLLSIQELLLLLASSGEIHLMDTFLEYVL